TVEIGFLEKATRNGSKTKMSRSCTLGSPIYTIEATTLIPFSLPILSPTFNIFSPATFWLPLNL
ncbi:hypothetical protein CR513_48261, partial [Mucuna pruriens]